jgi:hypothetical protein
MTNAKPTQKSLDELTTILPIHLKNLLKFYKEEIDQLYSGYRGLADYYEGQYRACRTVQLMIEGSEFLAACKIAQEEIDSAKAEIKVALAKAEGRQDERKLPTECAYEYMRNNPPPTPREGK